MNKTDNFKKHTHRNPIQRMLLWNFFETLLGLIKEKNAQSILDVGCGEGFTLNRLSENKIGAKLEGVEYSKAAIELGQKTYNSFDLVLCTEVLEHLDDPQKGLRELIRVSKKYLVISVPNEPLFMMAQFIRGKNWSRFGNDIEHINHWTFWQFGNFVKKENIKVLGTRHPFAWTMLLLEKK